MDEAAAIQLGRGLRQARLSARRTLEQVAAAVGLAPEVYARVERGRLLPTPPTLAALCIALRVRPEWPRRGPSSPG